jgi:hypothetical protein
MCDTRSSLLLCRVAVQRRHLPSCRRYPTGTGVAGNRGVGSSRHNVASSARMAGQDVSSVRDFQHQRGREPGSCGLVNFGETLLNVVMTDKRKMLFTLGPKGMWSSPAVIQSAGAGAGPPAKRRDPPHTATTTERGKPVVFLAGRPAGKARRKACRKDGGYRRRDQAKAGL